VVLAAALAPLALLAAIKPSFTVAPFTAVMVLLVPMLTHISPLESAYYRVIEVALGGVVALAVSFLVFPERAHGLLIEAGARLLARLHQLRGLGDAKVLKSLGHSPKGRHYRG
jgi:uncharacterized membrane protein YccC